MIISEEFPSKKNFEESQKLKSMLKELNLPEKYSFDYGKKPSFAVHLCKKVFFSSVFIAKIYLLCRGDDVICLSFEIAEDYEEIEQFLKDSNIKFEITIREGGYY